jgi:CPA1 family monovalent cation:H+ antiporter
LCETIERVNARRLRSIPIFAGLEKDELRRVADCSEEIEVPAGHQLLHEGRFAFEFFAIASGSADVVRDGISIAQLGPGDVFGEGGALAHGQRNASVVATAPSTVIFIRAQDFRHFTEDMPELGARIRLVVEERTRALEAPLA